MDTKRVLKFMIVAATCICSCQPLSAQKGEETVVRDFIETLANWCKTGDDMNREKLGQLTNENVGSGSTGGYGCRVNNRFMKQLYSFVKAKRPNSNIDIGKGTIEVSTYLNYLTWAIEDDMSYKHDSPVWLKDFKEPVAFEDKTEAPLYVFDVDETTEGAVNFKGINQYWVRGNQITFILDHDDPLAQAVELYSKHEYEKAFNMFRELAYASPENYEAQYYTAVMEIKKQGCGNLDSKVRDTEAAWWITRGTYASTYSYKWYKERMKKLYARYSVDETKLPYTHGRDFYLASLMSRKLVSNGMMPVKRKAGKYWYYSFMNEKGKVFTPFKYTIVFPFNSNGLALVATGKSQFGFVNKQGKEVIPLKYDSALSVFKDGKTFVVLNGDLLIINEQGEVIKEVGKGFEDICPDIVNGLVYTKNKNSDKWYLYDMDGELSSVENNEYRLDYTKSCFYVVGKDGKRVFEEPFPW